MTNPINGKPVERVELVSRLIWHLVQLLIAVALALGFYFKLDNRVTNNTEATNNARREIAEIDSRGTRKSHETDSTQEQSISELNRRVTNLESILRDLVPKVERIDTNVLVLMTRENKK